MALPRQHAAVGGGPGWMPAIVAATVLLGIAGFICCGVSTWVLFQQRTEFAIRTLRGSYIPALEQSLLDPQEKNAVVSRMEEFASELEQGKYENWQAAGVLQRMQRLPVLQWGELEAVQGFIEKSDDPQKQQSLEQLSRLRRGVELGKATSFDFEDILQPVLESDDQSPGGRRIIQPLTSEGVKIVIGRAKRFADAVNVPEQRFDVSLDSIIRREIDAGLRDGSY